MVGVGAVPIGIVAGGLAIAAWRVFKDTRVQTVVSVALPFVAYVPALLGGGVTALPFRTLLYSILKSVHSAVSALNRL